MKGTGGRVSGRLFIGGRNLYFAMKIFHSPVGDR